MQWRWDIAAFSLAFAALSEPAFACRVAAPLDLNDVRYADVVVMGRIANYRIVLDQQARQERKKMLARSPHMAPELRNSLQNQATFLSDYARFDVVVDRVLTGVAPKIVTVTWNNSTFAEPQAMSPGQYLVALRNPSSTSPPLRGPSATVLANREPGILTVLQAPCAPAFIFESASASAVGLRRILGAMLR